MRRPSSRTKQREESYTPSEAGGRRADGANVEESFSLIVRGMSRISLAASLLKGQVAGVRSAEHLGSLRSFYCRRCARGMVNQLRPLGESSCSAFGKHVEPRL